MLGTFDFAENTRAAYPIEYIPNAKIPCVAPHAKNVILLACDAFGVLPPVSKLNLAQTMYHFISGYTALVLMISFISITYLHYRPLVILIVNLMHETGCRDRGWYKRTTGYILCLFRGSIYNDAPYQICSNAGRKDAEARGYWMACQYWLVRRKVWTFKA